MDHPIVVRLSKTPTGIEGFDEITGGGLPTGRPSLVCGSAGCGKTLFAMSFLVHGAARFDEPGVFMSFEESTDELAQNVASLGFDLAGLIQQKKLAFDHVRVERSEIEETGDYDLEGLFIRLGYAIDSIGAKRVVLDTIESLFAGLANQSVLRAELRRLFRWLKDKGVTAVITGERGEGTLTRQGLEEYVSDAVILLDHRVTEEISTRRLRIVKYRGSSHGTNEYPFLIDEEGIAVLPVTTLSLNHAVSPERVSTGIARLDTMLDGKGYYRGTTVLVSGTAGSGKTSISAHFVDAACRRGERAMMFLFEESPAQVMRNMKSIGVDLQQWVGRGLLEFQASRPSTFGLEMHLSRMHRAIERFKPKVVILDPISSLLSVASSGDVHGTMTRLVDYLKSEGITALLTNLTHGKTETERTDTAISSVVDTWLLLITLESSGERNRGLYVLKARGMSHSNQIREFILTDHGVDLLDVYAGAGGVLTGSARLSQEAEERAKALVEEQELERRQRALARLKTAFDAELAALQARFETEQADLLSGISQNQARVARVRDDRRTIARSRRADAANGDERSKPRADVGVKER
ncbi:MAG TPA: circadian clock protein KaiC [Methylomirabilota bacterium]|nr:circadian clock protein KaiC [Methylomirabilota bacterium]